MIPYFKTTNIKRKRPYFCLMDNTPCMDYARTGYFSKLITDYLAQNPALQDCYHRFPSLENYRQLAAERVFSPEQRALLSEVLGEQYAAYRQDSQAQKVWEHIEALREEQSFTITTGHQLNIFTGPLYFIYKIISTINICRELNRYDTTRNYIPVYWMASEDHDFDEINHLNLYGGRLHWPQPQEGATGHMPTAGLASLINELQALLGPGEQAAQWTALLREAYEDQPNLAAATRHLVHRLFCDEGLLIINADHEKLKRAFLPVMEDDLWNHRPQKEVQSATDFLEEKYFKQIHARPINLFYLGPQYRERIEKQGDSWKVLQQDKRWQEAELRAELHEHPERFSPNVVLRPLYQEMILPNLGYVGGGGELAYWLQLKGLFDYYRVAFPALHLRNSAMLVSDKQKRKAEKWQLSWEELFLQEHKLAAAVATQHSSLDLSLQPFETKLLALYDDLEELAQKTDGGMIGAVHAQRQKQLNGLENLRKKLLRAEKRQHHEQVAQALRLREELFPGGSLQERHANFSEFYARCGASLLSQLKEELQPFDFCFRIIFYGA